MLEKKLTYEALPRRRTGREMSVMRKMPRAIPAEDIFPLFQFVMMKRREKHHRQDDRQQPDGEYASLQGHGGCKGTKKCLPLTPWRSNCIRKRFPN